MNQDLAQNNVFQYFNILFNLFQYSAKTLVKLKEK